MNYELMGDYIMISNYVRYERLETLINNEFRGSNYNEINLFIDAYSMIKSIYKLSTTQFIDKFSIASCIINACAHYRNFFWTRYRVTCKIWVVFSRMDISILEARQFYPNYGNIFTMESNPEMDKLIQENMEILNMICPYLPDIQFIYSGFEPGLVFSKVINTKYGENKPNIIITKDVWNLQVVGNNENTYIIRPIKRNNEDLSILINRKYLLYFYEDLRKIKMDSYTTNVNILHPSYISFIMAATRFPERGVKTLHNLSTIIKALINATDKSYIPKGKIYDIESLCNCLNTLCKSKLKSYEIRLRMNAFGYDACMLRYLNNPMCDNIEIVNLYDPDSIKRINETYFSKVPLDLMSL